MSAHREEAQRLVLAGRQKVGELRSASDEGRRDALGKQVIGIWAQAQVEATLALVFEQRTANLLAYLHPIELVDGKSIRTTLEHATKINAEIFNRLGMTA